jgi:hypothetical protein
MERAIASGSALIHKPSNLTLERVLPEVSRQTGKIMGRKSYDDLSKSKHLLMRKIFARQGGRKRSSKEEVYEDSMIAEMDVDIRVSYQRFRTKLQERSHTGGVHQLQPTPEPTLVSIFKFNQRPFQPQVILCFFLLQCRSSVCVSVSVSESESESESVCLCVCVSVCLCVCVCV